MNVLLIDDERSIRLTLGDALEEHGHSVVRCENMATGRQALRDRTFDCVVTDLQLPDGIGIDLLATARELNADTSLLVITAHQSIDTAIQATKVGADYLVKPFLNEEVIARLQKIEELRRLRAELRELRTQVTDSHQLARIIGRTVTMQELYKTIETVGPSDANVLITGESGTGKELAAEAIHRNSNRCDKRLVKLSCAAFPENLLEDELFGHEKGAFTDARERKAGRFELADGGSIFLDDIDDMSIQTQVKLLRVVQEREFERLGGTKTIKISVRIITAAKVDLSLLVRQGRFRDDLYFRLRVIELHMPPLRDRVADVPLLVHHFINRHGNGRRYRVDEGTLQRMSEYSWPGNVRELENAVMRAIAMAGGDELLAERYLLQTPMGMRVNADNLSIPSIGGTLLSPHSSASQRQASDRARAVPAESPAPSISAAAVTNVAPAPVPVSIPSESFRPLRDVVADAERAYIEKALQAADGSKTRAAELLDISRKNLWQKMRDLGMPL